MAAGEGLSFYQRMFGVGPLGLMISLFLLALAWAADALWLHSPPLVESVGLRWAAAVAALVYAVSWWVWAMRSMDLDKRGRELCTRGAYARTRHPWYGCMVAGADWGLALALGSWVYLVWAGVVLVGWSLLVRQEEAMMEEVFGQAYRDYKRRSWQFFPKFI